MISYLLFLHQHLGCHYSIKANILAHTYHIQFTKVTFQLLWSWERNRRSDSKILMENVKLSFFTWQWVQTYVNDKPELMKYL